MIKKVKSYRIIKISQRNLKTAGYSLRAGLRCIAMVQYRQLAVDGVMVYGISQTFKMLLPQLLCFK